MRRMGQLAETASKAAAVLIKAVVWLTSRHCPPRFCTAGAAGTFALSAGSPNCTRCGRGTYQSLAGASTCVLCPVNTTSWAILNDPTNVDRGCEKCSDFCGATPGQCWAADPRLVQVRQVPRSEWFEFITSPRSTCMPGPTLSFFNVARCRDIPAPPLRPTNASHVSCCMGGCASSALAH